MGKGIIYSNPSGDKALENVYKKLQKDPSFKPPRGDTFNVNTMKKAKAPTNRNKKMKGPKSA